LLTLPDLAAAAATATVVVHQDAVPRSVEIIELAAFERIPKHPADQKREDQTDRNQQKDDIDGRYSNTVRWALTGRAPVADGLRNSLSAFAMTNAELAAMPIPASNGVIKPHAAKGTASAL